MRLRLLFALTSVTALAFGCTREYEPSAEDYERDVEAVNAALASHVEAVNSGDFEANLAGLSDDLVYLPPDLPVVRGKEAVASLTAPMWEMFDAEMEMVPEETVISGDWAFQWGSLTGTLISRRDPDTTSVDAKWLYLYQRQADGSWMIARDIYNMNAPPGQNE